MTVDKKSYELAQQFLADYADDQFPLGQTRELGTQKLAEAIQGAVEEWLSDVMIPF